MDSLNRGGVWADFTAGRDTTFSFTAGDAP
jgi:hypothetical protein